MSLAKGGQQNGLWETECFLRIVVTQPVASSRQHIHVGDKNIARGSCILLQVVVGKQHQHTDTETLTG